MHFLVKHFQKQLSLQILSQMFLTVMFKLSTPQSFNAKNGVSKSVEDTFDNIIDKVGLDRLTSFVMILKSIPASPSRPDCSTNVLKVPPRVDFIGSSGEGIEMHCQL